VESIRELKKDEKKGTLITNDHLNVLSIDGIPDPNVWAIGDAATINGAPLPATAQGKIAFFLGTASSILINISQLLIRKESTSARSSTES
jgi:NADH dehydrogenase FAD-containing subunit